jgi:hypothetical protein
MRTLGKIAAALGVIGLIGIGGVLPASADWYGRHHQAITITTAAAHGMAADRVGRCRAASVSPTGMVRGTPMEGGRATMDINICGGRFGGLLFWPCAPAVSIAPILLRLSFAAGPSGCLHFSQSVERPER